jgi:hypothetical protein
MGKALAQIGEAKSFNEIDTGKNGECTPRILASKTKIPWKATNIGDAVAGPVTMRQFGLGR